MKIVRDYEFILLRNLTKLAVFPSIGRANEKEVEEVLRRGWKELSRVTLDINDYPILKEYFGILFAHYPTEIIMQYLACIYYNGVLFARRFYESISRNLKIDSGFAFIYMYPTDEGIMKFIANIYPVHKESHKILLGIGAVNSAKLEYAELVIYTNN